MNAKYWEKISTTLFSPSIIMVSISSPQDQVGHLLGCNVRVWWRGIYMVIRKLVTIAWCIQICIYEINTNPNNKSLHFWKKFSPLCCIFFSFSFYYLKPFSFFCILFFWIFFFWRRTSYRSPILTTRNFDASLQIQLHTKQDSNANLDEGLTKKGSMYTWLNRATSGCESRIKLWSSNKQRWPSITS